MQIGVQVEGTRPTKPSARRRRLLGGCALALAATLTACQSSGGDDDGSAKDGTEGGGSVTKVLTAATEKTKRAKSVKFTSTIKVTGQGVGQGDGEFSMSGSQSWDPVAAETTLDTGMLKELGAPEEMRLRMLDGVSYLDAGEQAAAGLGGKRWLRVDPAQLTEGEFNGMPSGAQQQDPAQQMSLLVDSPQVKKVGETKIGGVKATHYSGTVTLEEALAAEASGGVSDKERKRQLNTLKKQGFSGFDIDAWVGGDEYPVRTDLAMSGKKGSVKVSTRFTDYGTPVKVQAPPASQTVDLSDLDSWKNRGPGQGALS
ncbi:hypothetical protein E0L36_25470 [Streptomyces sp. AJS327]|uniref:hypothetical protein n=1 Tax=Streptomyces sp. AJS327 TaxID=2545265 RepID=UPI0015DED06D|nr:hypothetical protein [Streptomyces sp. AJS327]MBA0054076.1 hypothetical protein [Streptomyces sp. AJS327]